MPNNLLQQWLNSLLDTSRRNPMLHFTKQGLHIDAIEPHQLYQTVRYNNAELAFDTLLTNTQDTATQQKLLQRLYHQAKMDLEEHGLETLYLMFGFLDWFDLKKPDKNYHTPLLLVPVSLQQASIFHPFTLVRRKADIQFNPTLTYLFKQNYQFDLTDTIKDNLLDNFQKLNQICENNHWHIEMEVILGTLPFQKMVMYEDLKKHQPQIISHPILSSMLHNGLTKKTATKLQKLDHDQIKNTQCVLDADASQLDALMSARKGESFVLLGPPGTGKSQTIVNMLAQGMGDGKKMLFISEKKAALEVVEAGLKKVGLAPFCLYAYNQDYSAKALLSRLDECLNHHQESQKVSQASSLNDVCDELNSYINQVHQVIEPLHQSVYEVYGQLANLEAIPYVPLEITHIEQISLAEFQELNALLNQYIQKKEMNAHNCWTGTCLNSLTHAKRQEIQNTLHQLLSQKELFDDISKEINHLDLPFNNHINGLQELANYLNLISQTPANAHQWLDIDNLEAAYEKAYQTKLLHQQQTQLKTLKNTLQQAIPINDLSSQEKLNQYISQDAYMSHFHEIKNLDYCFHIISSYQKQYQAICQSFDPSILELDASYLLKQFKVLSQQFFKKFNPTYQSIKRQLSELSLNDLYMHDYEIIQTLQKVKHLQETKTQLKPYQKIYEALYNQDLDILQDKIKLYQTIQTYLKLLQKTTPLNEEIQDDDQILKEITWAMAMQSYTHYPLNLDVSKAKQLSMKVHEFMHNFTPAYETFIHLFNEPHDFDSMDIHELMHYFQQCQSHIYQLEDWLDYCTLSQKVMKTYLSQITQLDYPIEQWPLIFNKSFYILWLDEIQKKLPAIKYFRKQKHEDCISQLARLNKQHQQATQLTIQQTIIENASKVIYPQELTLFKKAKKKNTSSAYPLFSQIPHLITSHMPCFLMTPLACTSLLDASIYQFDTIIFDEASQLCIEDCIGPILRSKQVIIVGDEMQLPPTSFFQNAEVQHSLLDYVTFLPQHTLRWHYRSHHENLIAFSNQHFYHNQLITLPSNSITQKDMGLEYIFVEDGVYDNGNEREAMQVAQMVIDHFTNYPDRTLGVITFGLAQQEKIEKALSTLRQSTHIDNHFFEEPFFIRSLENVQGHQRDTIILSVGYAKNKNGKLHMNFGPLNQINGDKRLNVAITRSKYNLKVVSSLPLKEFLQYSANTQGLKTLQDFMQYASSIPNNNQLQNTPHFDSIFEKAVYQFLIEQGYQVDSQVGCSNYRIDLAIRNPNQPSSYILGIECDGASYHSSRTAKERDLLRHQLLENMGWKIYHIWSTNWIKDPINEKQLLLNYIENILHQ